MLRAGHVVRKEERSNINGALLMEMEEKSRISRPKRRWIDGLKSLYGGNGEWEKYLEKWIEEMIMTK